MFVLLVHGGRGVLYFMSASLLQYLLMEMSENKNNRLNPKGATTRYAFTEIDTPPRWCTNSPAFSFACVQFVFDRYLLYVLITNN